MRCLVTDYSTMGCRESIAAIRFVMWMLFSRSVPFNVFGTDYELRINVEIGVEDGWPVKEVIGAILRRCSEGQLFTALWNSGMSCGH